MADLNWYDERLTEKDHETEKWADIPEFNGMYRISSLGRIMSDYGQGYKSITPQKNNYGQVVAQLAFHPDKSQYNDLKLVMIAKTVARLFVPNPHKYSYISFKNGDSTDCRACNLEWTRVTDKMQEQYASFCKKVNQYDLKGTYITTYDSLLKASESTKIGSGSIGNACKSHKPTGEYLWRLESDVPQGENIEEYIPPKKKAVLQLDKKTGKIIRKYDDMETVAAEFVTENGGKVSTANIQNNIKGKRPSAYGYKWAYEPDEIAE